MRDISKEIGDSDVRQDLGVTLVEYGNGLMAEPGRGPDADAAFDESVAISSEIAADFPATTWYRASRATALLARANRLAATGRDDRALADLALARRLLGESIASEPLNWTYPGHLGRVEAAICRLRLRQGRGDEARQVSRRRHRPPRAGLPGTAAKRSRSQVAGRGPRGPAAGGRSTAFDQTVTTPAPARVQAFGV